MPKPLIKHMYTADPSANVFEGRIYLYPSHDLDHDNSSNDNGDQYDMVDYHVFSMTDIEGDVTDHGCALHIKDVPWASQQMWAPDAAQRSDGKYVFYFPARDKDGIFRLGAALSDTPAGPFKANPEPIKGSFSIDPCTFVDDDGTGYILFGGLWGGQLQCWQGDAFDADAKEPSGEGVRALYPKIAPLDESMCEFSEAPSDIVILDEHGQPLAADDHDRRYFEGPWLHKHEDTYYFSYSTGDTHRLVYATSKNIMGPYTYQGRILDPVLGWTTHHSTVCYNGQWYLFYHDASLSGGADNKRSVKAIKFNHDSEGNIPLIQPDD